MATSNSKAQPKPAQGAEEGAPKKKPKKKKVLVILIILLLLAGGGAGGWYYWVGQNAHSEPVKKKAEPPIFVSLDPMFTVNLQPDSGEHFLQTGMSLQVGKKEEVDLIKLHMPQVRSRLLLLLSSKKPAEIATTEGKNKLAQEIVEQVNLPFSPEGSPQTVSNVFFTSFVIQ